MSKRLALVLTAICFAPQAIAQTAPQPRVLAAWSQIFGVTAPEDAAGAIAPQVEMRFVLERGADCGAFGIDRQSDENSPWVAAGPATVRIPSAQAALAVEVCALAMATGGAPWRAARLTWAGAPARLTSQIVMGDTARDVGSSFAPGPSDGAAVEVWGAASIGARRSGGTLTAVTLGDTGCRGIPASAAKANPTPADAARANRMAQSCDADAWPLAKLAVAAAARAPDFVLHVGDYRYFLEDEVPDPPNGWLYWQKDFFPAAQPLLLAAPLVAARGNHEACGAWGFGDGYFQLFGPGEVTSCAGAEDPMPPEAFDVGTGPLAHRMVVLDTNDDAAEGLTESYRAAMALTRAGGPASAWWVTHIPAIALVDYEGREHTGDPDLQADLMAAPASGGLEDWFCGGAGGCRPSQILLGHQHLFQTLEFPEGGGPAGRWLLPRHVVVGHGGTKIDDASPAPGAVARCRYDGFSALASPGSGAPAALVETRAQHGVVIWTRTAQTLGLPAGWAMEPVWAENPPLPVDPDAGIVACKT